MQNPGRLLRFREVLDEVTVIRGLYGRLVRGLTRPFRATAQRLEDQGTSRGESGSGLWLSVTIVIWTVRMLLRMSRRTRDTVYSVQLQPGQQLQIRHLAQDRAGRAVRVKT
jgi:hypothetical protein